MSEYFREKRSLRKYAFFTAYVLLYIIFFEFIVPSGWVLPKPSLVLEAIPSLQVHYGLLINVLYTVSGIYLSMVLSYGVVWLLRVQLIGAFLRWKDFPDSIRLFKYFTAISFLTIYVYWFPVSNLSEILLTFLISLIYLLNNLSSGVHTVNRAYIEPFLPLKKEDSFLYKNIYWKSLKPALFNSLERLNIYLWTVVTLFEFVKGYMGIGNIYRLALSFMDLSGLWAVSIILAVIVALGGLVIKLLKRKVITWET
ncbi:MAG: ABC transporter permease [Acidobacteriota bacterium]